jgi:hypothetical protein
MALGGSEKVLSPLILLLFLTALSFDHTDNISLVATDVGDADPW